MTVLALLLAACPSFPVDRIEFDSDSRVLRGSYLGTVDTREVPFHMEFAGDASLLAASWTDTIEIWNLETLDLITSIDTGSNDDTWLGALSIDGTGSLVAGIVSGDVHVWNAHDGDLVQSLDSGSRLGACQYCGIYALSLNPAGELVAASGGAPRVLVFDVASGDVVRELETSGENTGFVAFTADGSLLAAASTLSDTRYALHVWDTATYELVFELEGTVDPSRYPRFAASADGQWLAVGSATKVELFALSGAESVLPLDELGGAWFWALSPDGSQVAMELADEPDPRLAILDVASGTTLATFKNMRRGNPVWSSDGRYLVADSRLVMTSDFEQTHDFATGELHALELEATASYVNTRSYTVGGTLSIDGGALIDFSGVVEGYESQHYLEPQRAPPRPATLDIELHDHPWRFEARQPYSLFNWPPVEPDGWWGSVLDNSAGPQGELWYPLRLWRAP